VYSGGDDDALAAVLVPGLIDDAGKEINLAGKEIKFGGK
jgi:hypothetical protein